MRRHWWMAIVLAMVSFSSLATGAGPGGVRKQIEASMLVTGSLLVATDGSVREYALDKPEALPSGVVEFLHGNIGQWKFEPTSLEGKAVEVRNKMSMRVVAKKQGEDEYQIRLQAVSFEPLERNPDYEVSSVSQMPPRYPMQAAKSGVAGSVYLVVKVAQDGTVADVFAEQVNMLMVASEGQMNYWRKTLAQASMQAARNWKFNPPRAGEQATRPYWLLRVPVDFRMGDTRPQYGKWEAYVPGPRQTYEGAQPAPGFSPDALVAGGLHQVGLPGLRLLTPLHAEG